MQKVKKAKIAAGASGPVRRGRTSAQANNNTLVRASSLNWSMVVTKMADATKVASKVSKMAKLMVQLLVVLSFATPAVAERCFKEVGEPCRVTFNLVMDVDIDVGDDTSNQFNFLLIHSSARAVSRKGDYSK